MDSGVNEKNVTIAPEEKEKSRGAFGAYMRIYSFSDSTDWMLNAIALFCAAGSGVALALVNLVFGDFVNVVGDFANGRSSPAQFRSDAGSFALNFVYIFIARFCLTYVFTVAVTISATRITKKIRFQFVKSTLSQEITFFDAENTGSVASQVTTNGNLIQQGIAEKLALSVQAISAFVAAFVIAIVAQWKLALISITIAPAIVIVTAAGVGAEAKIEASVLDIYGQAGALAEDVISSIRNVHAFWAEPKLVTKYQTHLQRAFDVGKKKAPVYGVLFSTEFFMVYAGYALAFWQGSRMYQSGEIDNPGTIVTVLFSVIIAASSMTQVAPHLTSFANAAAAAQVLFGVVDRHSDINPLSAAGKSPRVVEGDVEFAHVNFSYPTRPSVQVLGDFTLRFPAGKTTALVGASGSGKSTVVGLLERWYNPASGSILLDGCPIQDLNLKWLRTTVRLVQQEPVLFNGSVFDNVCNGLAGTAHESSSKDVQMRLVVDACKMAFAHDFISDLPDKYDTLVGERAGLLSGGQKQRIAIARSIVSDPRILLLDEATSALDPHAESIVQQALDKAAANRTTIVIAHKLATIKNADNIVVMSKGRILEQGSYQSLLNAYGAFARLVNVQSLSVDTSKGSEDFDEDTQEPADLTTARTLSTAKVQDEPHQVGASSEYDYEIHNPRGMLTIICIILREQRSLWSIFGVVLVFCLAGGATYPAQALLFSELLNVFNLQGSELRDKADFFSLMFFIVALANLLIYFCLGWTANVISQDITRFYRRQMFQSILRQDVQFFDRPENTTGALTSRLSSQPTQVQELMGINICLIAITMVSLVSSCALALAFGWKLGLVVIFGGLPSLVFAGWLRMKLETRMNKNATKTFADSASLAGEAVAAIRTVSSLALEQRILDRLAGKMDRIVQTSIPNVLHTMFWFALTQSVEFLVLALGFWYGCRLISTGEYSMKQFYIVFMGVFFAGQAAGQFFSYTTSITKAVGAMNYIIWLRSRSPIVQEYPNNRHIGPSTDGQSLDLQHIKFTYPTRQFAKVLRGISMTVEPGQFVAFVGGSGCGKSTMIALLERFYDPTSGNILLNQTNLAHMNPRLYRQHVSLVQQEPALYQGSIRENIALGLDSDQNVTNVAILEACRQSNMEDFVMSLPEGLNTACGSRGVSLSGGQRQRIAIARALIRNPKILLLDEATSALDTESERVVQEALSKAALSAKRITVAVAHRLSTIRDAHTIFVFSGGKIAEAGSHAQLSQRKGLYYEMCKAQSLDRAS
ncbi:hypothetical protein FH972_022676 [Carpinus fangiana]|uniref:ABC transporter domain-containing protein n=1 Tax=Carpinus fangiana TaxID=176857 RepID=A0A5N6KT91_9ROSI|nr:hypothetical protein FH972_022676 [Carpinus fangiana]